MATPRISILLPVFNAAATLPACLRSIQRQRQTDWECLVVDDGSTDGSGALARACADADARFRIISQPHRGLVAALNTGLSSCRGQFVARMDSDDVMHRDRLRAQCRLLARAPRCAGAGTHVRLTPRPRPGSGWAAYEAWLNSMRTAADVRRAAAIECPIAHPTLMMRRSVLVEFGYRDCGWPEDYDLLLRLLRNGHAIAVVPRRLLVWRNHPRRLSRCDPTYGAARFIACKAAHLAETFLAGCERYVLWGYGGTGRALSAALRTHGKEPAYIVDVHPGRIGNRIRRAPVIAPDDLRALAPHRIVVSVAGAVPRRRIRAALAGMRLREEVDFICAA